MIDAHPALKAASPQAPIIDWFMGDDWHHNGALFLPHCLQLHADLRQAAARADQEVRCSPFDHGTPDGYDFFLGSGPLANADAKHFKGEIAFWNELMKHGTYDEFWKARNLRPHLKNIKPAVLTVGGWFDAENLFGALETYKQRRGEPAAGGNILVMGPWVARRLERGRRRRLAGRRFASTSKTGRVLPREDRVAVLRVSPQGQGRRSSTPEAWVFETGTNRWRKHDAWPPQEAEAEVALFPRRRPASLRAARRTPATSAFDEYVSDPAKPVPYIDKISIGMAAEYMVADQRFAAPPARRARLPDRRCWKRTSRSPARSRPSCTSRPRGPTPTGSSS